MFYYSLHGEDTIQAEERSIYKNIKSDLAIPANLTQDQIIIWLTFQGQQFHALTGIGKTGIKQIIKNFPFQNFQNFKRRNYLQRK